MSIQNKNIFSLVLVAVFVLVASAGVARADSKCSFSRDLDLGAVGEDVRCLQKFLNSAGFKVADTGIGSPGNETSIFREKTKEALSRWQASKGITPATGYFGTLSRAAYEIIASPISPVSAPVVVTPPVTESTNSQLAKKVRDLIKKVRSIIEDGKDDIESSEDDGEDVTSSKKFADKADDKLTEALFAYLDEDYAEATALANRASEYMEDATEDIRGNKEDAEEAIDNAEEDLDEAADEIDDADDDGDDVDEAEDILDDAEDKLKDAREAFEDKDYKEALELAEEASDLADDAIDAIGN